MKTPYFIPRQYVESPFWRFLLDTTEGAERPQEPRFKQFADNLRSYVVSGAVAKTSVILLHSSSGPFSRIFAFSLAILGGTATLLCSAQLFGLTLIAFHW